MNQITIKNNKIIIDPTIFKPITPGSKYLLTTTFNELSEKALNLMKLFKLSKDDLQTKQVYFNNRLVITAYEELITSKDIQKELVKFKNIVKEINNLQSKGYELSPSASKVILKEQQLKADFKELLEINRIEQEMAEYNNGMGYNNGPAFLFFKEKKDHICGNLRLIESPEGFRPTSISKHAINDIDLEQLSLNQKKYLIIKASFLENI